MPLTGAQVVPAHGLNCPSSVISAATDDATEEERRTASAALARYLYELVARKEREPPTP